MSDVAETVKFLDVLAAFGGKLAQSQIATYGVEYQHLHFGSWTLELGRRHRRLLLAWDGNGFMLTLKTCDAGDSRSPRDWTLLEELALPGPNSAQQGFERAETLLMAHAES